MANGRRSHMTHAFSQIPDAKINRSQFDRSHTYKTTFDSGYLIPVYADEVLPGDTFNLKMSAFARLTTPIVPVMDNVFLESFFFFVPLRLIWTNFRKFMGEQDNPADSISYLVPTVTSPASGYTVGSLHDYLGLPTVGQVGGGNTTTNAAFWHRAYALIWNQWFRDENLQNSITVDTGDGPDTYSNYVIQRRGKRHDYFTSCLPWPQKGSTAVSLPLGTSAPVYGQLMTSTTNQIAWQGWNTTDGNVDKGGVAKNGSQAWVLGDNWATTAGGDTMNRTQLGTAAHYTALGSTYSPPFADLSSATAATINQIRTAIAQQQFLERDARGGTRYTEIVRSHFNVTSSDSRLQRAEYLGGGSTPIYFHPVAQTSPTAGANAQGQLAAFATGAASGHGFMKSFEEHGVLLGLVNVRVDLTYQQGQNAMFNRSTRYDFFWPTFEGIGEQAVPNKEIYMDGSGADSSVFGYQERYAEYRYKPSSITGVFRSTAASTLEIWHLAQKFTSLPTLNSTFIADTPPISRLLAVAPASGAQFYFDSYFDLKCARPMKVYSTPGLSRL